MAGGYVVDKIICGLRQVTSDMAGRAGRDAVLGDVDEHGLDLEAMEQYADRINGYAAELVASQRDPRLAYLESEARRSAGFYPPHSDGRNTFVIFADKIAALIPSESEQ